MRITVIGATGRVGSRVVLEALRRGHEVTAVVRNPDRRHDLPDGAHTWLGDAGDLDDVVGFSANRDAVVSATRAPAGREAEVVAIARTLLAGLARTGARLLVVGGAGGLIVPNSGGTLAIDDPVHVPAEIHDIAQAGIDQLNVCRSNDVVDWTCLSPPAQLQPGTRTGAYRTGHDELLINETGDSRISMEDFAVALLDELEHPRHHRARFTVAN